MKKRRELPVDTRGSPCAQTAATGRTLSGSESNRPPSQQVQEARYRLAEFISAHPDGIYFNDALWPGFQRYALFASSDSRLTREERQT